MDGLQHSLLAPTCGTFILVLGCVDAMMQMVHVRYSAEAKDENGKSLLPHPYKPWEVPVSKQDPTQPPPEIYDKAYRAFKMYENVKEWTFLSLPLMWTFAVYGKNALQPLAAFVAAAPWIPMTIETNLLSMYEGREILVDRLCPVVSVRVFATRESGGLNKHDEC